MLSESVKKVKNSSGRTFNLHLTPPSSPHSLFTLLLYFSLSPFTLFLSISICFSFFHLFTFTHYLFILSHSLYPSISLHFSNAYYHHTLLFSALYFSFFFSHVISLSFLSFSFFYSFFLWLRLLAYLFIFLSSHVVLALNLRFFSLIFKTLTSFFANEIDNQGKNKGNCKISINNWHS